MYIGTPPQSGFITTAKQRITSSTNNYVDLDHSISSLADVIVWVNFVKQDSTNLSLTTSTRITLGGTLVSSDIVEIAYLGKAVATQTPDTGTVTNDMLAGSIANSKLANSSITLNGSAVSLGGSATVGANTPQFFVRKTSSAQTLNYNTATLCTFNTEDIDTAGDFASNRYTFSTAGTYLITVNIKLDSSNTNDVRGLVVEVRKNGSASDGTHGAFVFDQLNAGYISGSDRPTQDAMAGGSFIQTYAQNDYLEIFVTQKTGTQLDNIGRINAGDGRNTYFGGYKIS